MRQDFRKFQKDSYLHQTSAVVMQVSSVSAMISQCYVRAMIRGPQVQTPCCVLCVQAECKVFYKYN
jgi:hypothetical protein